MRTQMRKIFTAAFLLCGVAWNAQGALQAVGPVTGPHGYPQWYQDSTGLKLELCPASDPMCISAPPVTAEEQALGVGEESFWWSADASAPPLVPGGKAQLTLALEAAFGGAGEAQNGQQIVFGRVRVRVDVPVAGTYLVFHPFSADPIVFDNVTVADGFFYTEDIGSLDFLDPVAGYSGALESRIGPFLTWPDFQNEPTLQVIDPLTAEVTAQYIGDVNVPHPVVGSPIADDSHASGFRNYFRIVGPAGSDIDVRTDLFAITGKVLPEPAPEVIPHEFPPLPPQKLFAVGPVNRAATVNPGSTAESTGADLPGYPIGFPLWYQERLTVPDPDQATNPGGTVEIGGLQLTLCPGVDPMCISEPVDPADQASVDLGVGEEAFWWSGEAFINDRTGDVDNAVGLDAILVLALEAAFGGTGAVKDGDQIAFGRVRVRVDVPRDGTYTIIHPYGTEVFENVTQEEGIIFTRDIGIIDPFDPDAAFVGTLFGDIGPTVLTWPDYADPLLNPTLQVPETEGGVPTGDTIQYIGDPALPHEVVGSPIADASDPSGFQNYFRIRGPNDLDVKTRLFAVTGKVFDPATFQVIPNPNAPVAADDSATTQADTAVVIDVQANDTVIAPPATAEILPPGEAFGPFNGTPAVNAGDNTVTYTPNAGFAGTDSFGYRITDAAGLVSNIGVVTVTVIPVETIAVTRAELDLRKLEWNLQGTSNTNGTTLTLHAGPDLTGAVIGLATVSRGKWQFRGRAFTNPNATSISVQSSTGTALLNQLLRIR